MKISSATLRLCTRTWRARRSAAARRPWLSVVMLWRASARHLAPAARTLARRTPARPDAPGQLHHHHRAVIFNQYTEFMSTVTGAARVPVPDRPGSTVLSVSRLPALPETSVRLVPAMLPPAAPARSGRRNALGPPPGQRVMVTPVKLCFAPLLQGALRSAADRLTAARSIGSRNSMARQGAARQRIAGRPDPRPGMADAGGPGAFLKGAFARSVIAQRTPAPANRNAPSGASASRPFPAVPQVPAWSLSRVAVRSLPVLPSVTVSQPGRRIDPAAIVWPAPPRQTGDAAEEASAQKPQTAPHKPSVTALPDRPGSLSSAQQQSLQPQQFAALADRLADDVIRRVERRMRIERERRGL